MTETWVGPGNEANSFVRENHHHIVSLTTPWLLANAVGRQPTFSYNQVSYVSKEWSDVRFVY